MNDPIDFNVDMVSARKKLDTMNPRFKIVGV